MRRENERKRKAKETLSRGSGGHRENRSQQPEPGYMGSYDNGSPYASMAGVEAQGVAKGLPKPKAGYLEDFPVQNQGSAKIRQTRKRKQQPEDSESEPKIGGHQAKRARKHREEEEEEERDEDEDEEGEGKAHKVHHHEIWDQLLAQTSQAGAYGKYDDSFSQLQVDGVTVHSPRAGKDSDDANDVTAFLQSQATWCMDRLDLPWLLTLWKRPESLVKPTYQIGLMQFEGREVVDWQGKPIRDFHNLPATISSNVEGARLEAWIGEDPRIGWIDVEQRVRTKVTGNGRVPITNRRYLSARARVQFRMPAGMISWVARSDTGKQTAYLDGLRTDYQKANNLSIDRDLTKVELNRLKALTVNARASPEKPESKYHPLYVNAILKHAELPAEEAPADSSSASDSQTVGHGHVGEVSSEDAATSSPDSGVSNHSDDELINVLTAFNSGTARDPAQHIIDESLTESSKGGFAGLSSQEDLNVAIHILDGGLASDIDGTLADLGVDSRAERPRSSEDENALIQALWCTIEYFKIVIGWDPVTPEPGTSYLELWSQLQIQYADYWRSLGKDREIPVLARYRRWTGGVSNWPLTDFEDEEQTARTAWFL